MSGRSRVVSWTGRGLVTGAVLGLLEAAERAWAVREFVRGPAELIGFAALAFTFVLVTGTVLGVLIGALSAAVSGARRLPLPPALARQIAGAWMGLAFSAWVLFALTLTVRFDGVIAHGRWVVALGIVAGIFGGAAWPLAAGAWHAVRSRPVSARTLQGLLVPAVLAVHLWNAHFAPQSSLGIHAIADTVLAGLALMLTGLGTWRPRGRALATSLVLMVAMIVWTDDTMRNRPVLENLIKTRGSISAHAIRLWSAALDFDRDGHAPPFLVGGSDPANFDPDRPPALLSPGTAPDTAAVRGPAETDPAIARMTGSSVEPRPNIALLTLDACRADVVPPIRPEQSRLGGLLPSTPNLERLSHRVARFRVGYTPSAGTEDTFAAIFSGWDLPGILSGVPRERTLTSRLAAAGYEVRGFVNDPRFAVSSFESERIIRYDGNQGARMMRDAVAFLDSLPAGSPGFAWIHVMDLHADLLKPFARETFSHRAHLVSYARALSRVDSMVGGFMQALDQGSLESRTLLVLSADHGEELGAHGHYHHNLSLYQAAIRVPLWIMGPGVVPGALPARVSLQSLYPTLLEAGGVEPGDAVGRSLWPMLRRTVPAVSDSLIYSFLPQRGFSQVYAQHRPELGQAALLDAVNRRKVILRLALDSWEAYDVAADSMERWNLAGGGATWPDSLRRQLETMIRERSGVPSGGRRSSRVELGSYPRPGSDLAGRPGSVAGTRQSR